MAPDLNISQAQSECRFFIIKYKLIQRFNNVILIKLVEVFNLFQSAME